MWSAATDMGAIFINAEPDGYHLTIDTLNKKFKLKSTLRSVRDAQETAESYLQLWGEEGDIILTDHQWKRAHRQAAGGLTFHSFLAEYINGIAEAIAKAYKVKVKQKAGTLLEATVGDLESNETYQPRDYDNPLGGNADVYRSGASRLGA